MGTSQSILFYGFLIGDGVPPWYDEAKEDDRTGQYRDCANEVLKFSQKMDLRLKVIFLNDGPGLLLGSMWKDYAALEESWAGMVKVVTLRMFTERITVDWLLE